MKSKSVEAQAKDQKEMHENGTSDAINHYQSRISRLDIIDNGSLYEKCQKIKKGGDKGS